MWRLISLKQKTILQRIKVDFTEVSKIKKSIVYTRTENKAVQKLDPDTTYAFFFLIAVSNVYLICCAKTTGEQSKTIWKRPKPSK